MKKNYYTLDEAASFLTERLDEKITPDAVLRFAASRESGLDLCIYFHGALEFQQENTEEGGLWPSFCISNNFRGYIKIPVDAIHPDRDSFSPFSYARVIEELSNGIFTDPSAEKVLFPTLYARRIESMDSSPIIPFHPQDATTLNILLEPQAQEPAPIPFEASRSESLIPEKSLLDFLKKNRKAEQLKRQTAAPNSVRGINKQEAAIAFQGIYWDLRRWRKYLGDPPDWLKECQKQKGVKGNNKISAIWDPVEIAFALLCKGISEEELNQAFKKTALKDWAGEWKEKTYS